MKALGLCGMHYAQVRRGTPSPVPLPRTRIRNVADVRARCIVTDEGCWEWTGSRTSDGYGRVGTDHRQVSTHRYVYEGTVGPVPDGLDLDHQCHNRATARGDCAGGATCRHRRCCNPDHLEPATRAQNLQRAADARPPLLRCKHNHDLTDPANVEATKDGNRTRTRCKPCRIERQRRHSQKVVLSSNHTQVAS